MRILRGSTALKYPAIVLATLLSIGFAANADATPRHGAQNHRAHRTIVCDQRGCSDNVVRAQNAATRSTVVIDANGGTVVSRRPAGCPRAYCGCEASLYLFGRIHPELNLAANWMRKFPRTPPAPGMAAVRKHHVMVLMRHVEGNNWLVHDGNSGGGLTREHVVSLRGYVVVNPRASYAENAPKRRESNL
ncbi:MAG TPA: hypothetical protein VFP60_10840 [Pseudolabrys sp.]|nr:hypothetical protein [Pseudolabrys sp.]